MNVPFSYNLIVSRCLFLKFNLSLRCPFFKVPFSSLAPPHSSESLLPSLKKEISFGVGHILAFFTEVGVYKIYQRRPSQVRFYRRRASKIRFIRRHLEPFLSFFLRMKSSHSFCKQVMNPQIVFVISNNYNCIFLQMKYQKIVTICIESQVHNKYFAFSNSRADITLLLGMQPSIGHV